MKKLFSFQNAIAEANRCLLCRDAPCSAACPAGTDPATFIRKLRLKNATGAIRTIKMNNILGGVCGALCPSARLCERECCAAGLDRPIEIANIQRCLIEHSWEIGFEVFDKPARTGDKVAVIGAGPAGLACAAFLARAGSLVTVFEEKPEAGGVLRYGVPAFRLPKEFLERELRDLAQLGIEFKFSSPMKDKDAVGNLLRNGYKAVFLATGLGEPIRVLKVPDGTRGFFTAMDFLETARTERVSTLKKYIVGKVLAVIGGGSVAIDCAMTALNFGASDVYLVYRRSHAQMPAETQEQIRALESGIHFLVLNQPLECVFGEDRGITGLKMIRTRLGPEDSSGRRSPLQVAGSEWELKVDAIIEAVGSGPLEGSFEWYPSVNISRDNTIMVDDKTGKTSAEGIFAGGDVARGPSLIVNAIRDGKTAAKSILEYLARILYTTS